MNKKPKLSRRERLAGSVNAFIRQYARKAYPTHDPNDRRYDRNVEKKVRRMDPEELDRLMRDDVDR